MSKSLRAFLAVAVTFAAGFAFAATAFSYWTLAPAATPACAGREVVQGFRSGPMDILVLPLFTYFNLAVLVAIARSNRTLSEIQEHDVTIFELGAFRLSHGMFVVGAVCLGVVSISYFIAEKSVNRYLQIASYCQSTLLPAHDQPDGRT